MVQIHINDLIGNFGRYHFWLCALIFFGKFGTGLHQMAIIILAPPAVYTCPNSNSTCCENPVYDTTTFSRTIVTEWNLICDKSWLKDFTQTVFQFGVLIGSLIFGIASDRYGRKKVLLVSAVLQMFTGVVAAFMPDFWSFTIIRFILGLAVGGVMVAGFVLIMEYVGTIYRDVISNLFHVPFTLGHMALALFGYFIRDYVIFQFSISVANLFMLIYICFLPESPRWLLAKNKTSKAITIMERIAEINYLPKNEVRQQVETYQLQSIRMRQKKGNALDLFRTPNLRSNILVMSFIWFVSSYCYYGVSHYISHLTGDIFVNVVASSGVCLFGCFLAIPLVKFIGRRILVIIFNISSSICLVVIAFIPEGIGSVIMGCVGVLFSFMSFIVVYLYCTEMFPTVVRNSAIGISSMMARFGSMVAPFVAGLRPHGKWCAPITFGVFPIIAAILCILLPETKDIELPMTIEEGEAMGRNSIQQRHASAMIDDNGEQLASIRETEK
ncbi:organic cation transporter protein-like isoform X1 [Maniola hyperantus]|uniref:organic cation transporter protein-like isoform X1 n=2 Tax=Aphantopus hyperantus TaxID=2795564 RepID=UPI00156912CD|nr:organic cation transporter protein-like isoform X1 [Maniola hyperantus]